MSSWKDIMLAGTKGVFASNDTDTKARQAEEAARRTEESVTQTLDNQFQRVMDKGIGEVQQEIPLPDERERKPLSPERAKQMAESLQKGNERIELTIADKTKEFYDYAQRVRTDTDVFSPMASEDFARQRINDQVEQKAEQRQAELQEQFYRPFSSEGDKFWINKVNENGEIVKEYVTEEQLAQDPTLWNQIHNREFNGREMVLTDEAKDIIMKNIYNEANKYAMISEAAESAAAYATPGAMLSATMQKQQEDLKKIGAQEFRDAMGRTIADSDYYKQKLRQGHDSVQMARNINAQEIERLIEKNGGARGGQLSPEEMTELEFREETQRIYADIDKMYERAKRYDDRPAIDGWLGGAKDWLTDIDNYTLGLPAIRESLDTRRLMKKAQEAYGTGDLTKLSQDQLEALFTPAQMEFIGAIADKGIAAADLDWNTAVGYKGAQGTLDMIQFMLEMALFGGAADAATKKLITSATKKGVVSPELFSAAHKLVKTGEEKALVDGLSKAIFRRAGGGLSGAAQAALVKVPSVAWRTGVITALSPSTYKQVAEDLAQTDDSGKVVDAWSTIGRSLASKSIDVLTEQIGGAFDFAFAKAGDYAFNTLFRKNSNWLTKIIQAPFAKTIRQGALNGFIGEGLEEVVGAALMDMTGLEPGAWKEFWKPDNLAVLAATLAPASLFGTAVSAAQVAKSKIDYNKAYKDLANDPRIDKEWLDKANAAFSSTPLNELFSTKNDAFRQMLAEHPDQDLQQKLATFMAASAKYNANDAIQQEKDRQQNAAVRKQMEDSMGGSFVRPDNEGNEIVDRVYLKGGQEAYIVGEQDGAYTVILRDPKPGQRQKQIRTKEDFMTLSDENGNPVMDVDGTPMVARDRLDVDAFLRGETLRTKSFEEQQRMKQEYSSRLKDVKKSAAPGVELIHRPTIEDEPIHGVIENVSDAGVTIKYETPVDIDGRTNKVHNLTWEQYAREAGYSLDVKNDEQLTDRRVRLAQTKEMQRRAVNDAASGKTFAFEGKNYLIDSVIPSAEDEDIDTLTVAVSDIDDGYKRSTIQVPAQELMDSFGVQYRDYGNMTIEDFGGDENAMWNASPESWAKFNDERNSDGGKDTIRRADKAVKTIARQIAAREALIQQTNDQNLIAQYQADIASLQARAELLTNVVLDNYGKTVINDALGIKPKASQAAPAQQETKQEPVKTAIPADNKGKKQYHLASYADTIADLSEKLSPEEVVAFTAKQVETSQKAVDKLLKSAPEMGDDVDAYVKARDEYAKNLVDAQTKLQYWQGLAFQQALVARDAERESADYVAAFQQTVDSIKAETNMTLPTLVVTMQNYEKAMRDAGMREQAIKAVKEQIDEVLAGRELGHDFQLNGLQDNGQIVIFTEFNADEAQIRRTLSHEGQHLLNLLDPAKRVQAEIARIVGDQQALEQMVCSLSGAATDTYKGRSAAYLADEVSAFALEEPAINEERLRKAGANDELINFIKQEYERKQSGDYWSLSGRDALDDATRPADNQSNEPNPSFRSEEVGGQGQGSAARSAEADEADAVSETKRIIQQTLAGGIDLGDGQSVPASFSVTSIVDGCGFTFNQDEEGKVFFSDASGKVFNKQNHITPVDLKSNKGSVFDMMMEDARNENTIDMFAQNIIYQKTASMLNAFLDKEYADVLAADWQLVGDTVMRTINAASEDEYEVPAYRPVSTNSDSQYSYSADIIRVCKKNEAVLNTISQMQREKGFGITPGQILNIYLATNEADLQVPCPVCYVFTRYIRNGQYASILINGKRKYQDAVLPSGEKVFADYDSLTQEQRQEREEFWKKELEAVGKVNKSKEKAISRAKKVITEVEDEINSISKKVTRSQEAKQRLAKGEQPIYEMLTDEQEKAAIEKVALLDKKYRAALQVVSVASLDGWIKQVALDSNGRLRKDYKANLYPDEVALDYRLTSTAMRDYPEVQRYRNSRGAAAGKEVAYASNNDLGEIPSLLGAGDPKIVPNYYQMAAKETDPKKKEKLREKASKRFHEASMYARKQSLRGGQRMWSWSDNIERLAPDVFMNMVQLQMLGGALQSYSKQLEGIKLVATMGGYVNGSLMAKDNGYVEVPKEQVEEIDGRLYVKDGDYVTENVRLKTPVFFDEKDGKYYTLIFDDVVGVDAFGVEEDGKHKLGLFELNEMYDKAGNIMVGMNDRHIQMCLADDRIFFVIPWHSSGANVHILAEMFDVLGMDGTDVVSRSKDYTLVQEEKYLLGGEKISDEEKEVLSDEEKEALEKESKKGIKQEIIDFWNRHYQQGSVVSGVQMPAGKEFKCCLGEIPSGDGKGNLSQKQIEYKALRDAIFEGKLTDEQIKMVQADEFLGQVYNIVSDPARSGNGKMTAGDKKFIYPYEYWDMNSTYGNADVNGARYLEYCRRLGYKPKFCGKLNAKAKDDFGNFVDCHGYWKLLIDRRMYTTRANGEVFQDLTAVSAQNFTPDIVDPEKTKDIFHVTTVADDAKIPAIISRATEIEKEHLGGETLSVDYGKGLEESVKEFVKTESDLKAFVKQSGKSNVPGRVIKKLKPEEQSSDTNFSFIDASLPYVNDPNAMINRISAEERAVILQGCEEWYQKTSKKVDATNVNGMKDWLIVLDKWIEQNEKLRVKYQKLLNTRLYADSSEDMRFLAEYEANVAMYQRLRNDIKKQFVSMGIDPDAKPYSDIIGDLGLVKRKAYSLADVRTWFDKYNKDEQNKMLFDLIMPAIELADKIGTEVRLKTSPGRFGTYSAADRLMTINPAEFSGDISEEQFAKTLLHESIHAVTSYALWIAENQKRIGMLGRQAEDNIKYIVDNMPKELLDAANQLNDIFKAVTKDAEISKQYGGKDVHEMLAEMANPKFRELLKERKLYEVVLDGITRFLSYVSSFLSPKPTSIKETTGYDAIYSALKNLVDNYNGMSARLLSFANEADMISRATNFSFTERNNQQKAELFRRAKDEFGTTEDFREAGYILPDGDMLDFSEKNDGGPAGQRTLDHRSIMRVISDEREYDYATAYMYDFLNEGAVRLMPESASITIMKPLSVGEKMALRKFIRQHNGEVIVDIVDENGRTSGYKEYDAWTEPDKVFSQIESHFNGYPLTNDETMFSVSNNNQAMFVSNAQSALEKVKMEKATPAQWKAMLSKEGGIKAGEDKWLGLSEWLDSSDKKTLAKDEVRQFIQENAIKIEETRYAENVSVEKAARDIMDEKYKPLADLQREVNANAESADRFDREKEDGFDLDGYLMDCMVQEYGEEFADAYSIMDGEINYADEVWDIDEENVASSMNPEQTRPINSTRLLYTDMGLENKREVALAVPTIEPWNEDDDIHFGDAGQGRAIAWSRFGEATDAEGNPVLVIDEIQSKRHQEGRDKGYADNSEIIKAKKEKEAYKKEKEDFLNAMFEKYGKSFDREMNSDEMVEWQRVCENLDAVTFTYNRMIEKPRIGVPAAPFEKNWHELAFKRMLRLAAEEGYDKVAWTNGDMQAKRYSLSDKIEDFYYKQNGDGTYTVSAVAIVKRGRGDARYEDYKNYDYNNLSEKDLVDTFGKDVAEKVISGKGRKGYQHNDEPGWTTFKGKDLELGGEGMKGFYDKMLPAFVDKYCKKWGVKTEDITLPGLKNKEGWHSVSITPEMKASVMEGQPMFSLSSLGTPYYQFKGDAKGAIDFLRGKKEGQAIAALFHPSVGYIDLPWGEEGTGHSDGFGLAKLIKFHPDVVDNLQEIVSTMKQVSHSANRVNLQNKKYRAGIRLDWNNERKTWLLTLFEKKNSVFNNTTDTVETSERGRGNDTATPQNAVSTSKDTNNLDNSNISEASDQMTSFSIREGESPKQMIPVYKLMRLGEDGKVYPLYIDRNAMPIELGIWYDADAPKFGDIEKLPEGFAYLLDADGNFIDKKEVGKGKNGNVTGIPSKGMVDNLPAGQRWIVVSTHANGEKAYYNVGINGAESTGLYAMRPGWHAGKLPSMWQIGKGSGKNLRDDNFVWVRGKMAADHEYVQGDEGMTKAGDMPTRMPVDGFYAFATNPKNNAEKKAKKEALARGEEYKGNDWYVSGAFMPEEIISDKEARRIIDEYNSANGTAVPYDFTRESGREFNAETMSLEDATNFSVRKDYYDRQARNVQTRNDENRKTGSENGMTEEQADAIEYLARIRHEIHSNKDSAIKDGSGLDNLIKANDALVLAGLPKIESIPTGYGEDYIDIDNLGVLDAIGVEYNEVEEYARISGELEILNDTIEKYLGAIDERFKTHYAPTGLLRIQPTNFSMTEKQQYQSAESERQLKVATDLLGALKEAGLDNYYISRSKTDFGVSTYVQPEYGTDGLKFRTSDHSVTSARRVLNEIAFDENSNVADLVSLAEADKQRIDSGRLINANKEKQQREEAAAIVDAWNEIASEKFSNYKFLKNERTYDDLDAFSAKNPNAEYIRQTILDIKDGEQAYAYEYAVAGSKHGTDRPSLEYMRDYVRDNETGSAKQITYDNFFKGTKAVFRNINERPDREPDYVSRPWNYGFTQNDKVSSEYWYGTDEGGDYVVRGSDHWGKVGTCNWDIEGEDLNEQKRSSIRESFMQRWGNPTDRDDANLRSNPDYVADKQKMREELAKYTNVKYGKAYLKDFESTSTDITNFSLTEAEMLPYHSQVAEKGLASFLGEQGYYDFMFGVLNDAPEGLKEELINNSMSAGFDFVGTAAKTLADISAKETLTDAEQKLIDAARKALDKQFPGLTDADAKWMLYNNTYGKPKTFADIVNRSVVAFRLGFDKSSEAVKMENQNDTNLRLSEADYDKSAANLYSNSLDWKAAIEESQIDMYASLRRMVEAIEKASGKPMEAFENPLLAFNQLVAKDRADIEKYNRDFLHPMWKAVNTIIAMSGGEVAIEDVQRYLMLKHGLERNFVLAKRDALNYWKAWAEGLLRQSKSLSEEERNALVEKAQKAVDDINKEISRKEQTIKTAESIKLDASIIKEQRDDLLKERFALEEKVREAELIRDGEEAIAKELAAHEYEIDYGIDPIFLENRKKDYSGIMAMYANKPKLTRLPNESKEAYAARRRDAIAPTYDILSDAEEAAEQEVGKFERMSTWKDADIKDIKGRKDVFVLEAGQKATDLLWEKINAATKETLRHQYESGMLTKDSYDHISGMFKYYVPLRGFAEDTAEDIYNYYGSNADGTFINAVLSAKGRTSEAESPLGVIGVQAQSAIRQDNKNLAKQAIYYFVSNREDNDLATIDEGWYENTGMKDARGRTIYTRLYPDFTSAKTAEEMKQIRDDFDAIQEQRKEQGVKVQKGRRGLDLKNSVIKVDKRNVPEHMIRLKVNGEDAEIIVNGNPRAAQAVNGLLNVMNTDNSLMKGLMAANKFFSQLATSANPNFIVSNIFRDIIYAQTTTMADEGAEYTAKFDKYLLKLLNGGKIFRLSVGEAEDNFFETKVAKGNPELARLYREYVENGGPTGYTVLANNEEWEDLMRKYIKEQQGSEAIKKLQKAVRNWNRIMEGAEQAARFSAYLASKEMGKSIPECVDAAKEVTLNFDRKGSGKPIPFKQVSQFITTDNPTRALLQSIAVEALTLPVTGRFFTMFYNAAMQGLRKFVTMFKKSPKFIAATCAGYTAAGMLNAFVHGLMGGTGGDDPEELDKYFELPDFIRRRFLCIDAGNGNYFRIPLPQEFVPFYALGDVIMTELLYKRSPNKTKYRVWAESLSGFTELLPYNPLNDITFKEGLGEGLIDMVLRPVPIVNIAYSLHENRTFYGAPIHNEPFQKENAEYPAARYKDARESDNLLNPLYTKIAEAASKVGRREGRETGPLNWYVENIQYVASELMGGAGKFWLQVASSILGIAEGESIPKEQIPFLNRILVDTNHKYSHAYENELYYWYSREMLKGVKDQISRNQKDFVEENVKVDENLTENEIKLLKKRKAKLSSVINNLDKVIKNENSDEARRANAEKNQKRLIEQRSEIEKRLGTWKPSPEEADYLDDEFTGSANYKLYQELISDEDFDKTKLQPKELTELDKEIKAEKNPDAKKTLKDRRENLRAQWVREVTVRLYELENLNTENNGNEEN